MGLPHRLLPDAGQGAAGPSPPTTHTHTHTPPPHAQLSRTEIHLPSSTSLNSIRLLPTRRTHAMVLISPCGAAKVGEASCWSIPRTGSAVEAWVRRRTQSPPPMALSRPSMFQAGTPAGQAACATAVSAWMAGKAQQHSSVGASHPAPAAAPSARQPLCLMPQASGPCPGFYEEKWHRQLLARHVLTSCST